MVLSIVKYALVGYVVVRSSRYVARKVGEWRSRHQDA